MDRYAARYAYQHGQHAMYEPRPSDLDLELGNEEVIIEEVIDSHTITVRPLNSDVIFNAKPERLGPPFGESCRCRD